MQNLLVFLATAEPSPGEDLREGLDPEMVTPGTLGFLATLFVVIAVIFLIRDMTKRIRRVRYREQVQMEADSQGDNDGEGDDDGQGDDDGEGTGGEAAGPSGEGTPDGRFDGEASNGGAHNRGGSTERGGTTDRSDYDGGTDKANDTSDGAARRLKDSNGAGPDRKG